MLRNRRVGLWIVAGGLLVTVWELAQPVEAGKIVGEESSYAREQGFRTRFFYVASGNGEGQVEYICKAFPGVTAASSTANAVWQVRRFAYDSSNRISTILFAGNDDAYNQICDNRASLTYQ